MSYNYNYKQLDHKKIKFKWDLKNLNIINDKFFLCGLNKICLNNIKRRKISNEKNYLL